MGVYHPLSVRSDSGQELGAIAEALQIGLPVAADISKRNQQRDADQGRADALAGTIDPEKQKRSRAYSHAAEVAVTYNKTITELEKIRNDAAEFKRGNPEFTVEQLDEFYAARIKQFLVDEETGDATFTPEATLEVLPLLQREKDAALAEAGEQIRAEVQTQVEAGEIRRFDAEISAGADPTEAVVALNNRLAQTVDRSRLNGVMFSALANLAVQKADPSILEAVPEQWANGAPTFRNIPEFRGRFTAAVAQAEAAAANAATQRSKLADQASEFALLSAIVGGEYVSDEDIVARIGVSKPNVARQLISFKETINNGRDEDAIDFDRVNLMRARVFSNASKDPVGEVMALYEMGVFGPTDAKQTAQVVSALLSDAQQMASFNARQGSSTTSIWREMSELLDDSFPITKDLFGKPNREQTRINLELKEKFAIETLRNGKDPVDVRRALEAEYRDAYDDATKRAATVSPADLTPAGKIKGALGGNSDLILTVSQADIENAALRGEITPEQERAALLLKLGQ